LIELAKKRKHLYITAQSLPRLTQKALANLLRHYPGVEILEVFGYAESSGTQNGLILAGGLSKNSKLQQLCLKSMHLKSSVMTGISKLLLEKTSNLKRFGIVDNPITDAGAVWLAQALQSNNTITELDLSDCDFANKPSWLAPKTGTTELATVLKNTSTLVTLKLRGNSINPKSVKELGEGLKTNKTLTYLDLNDNKIADEGVQYLFDSLQTNKTLETLLIGENEITNKGAEVIADMIPITNLGCIGLPQNLIGDRGCQLITSGLRKGSRVHTLIFRGNQASVDVVAELYIVCPAGQTL